MRKENVLLYEYVYHFFPFTLIFHILSSLIEYAGMNTFLVQHFLVQKKRQENKVRENFF